MSSRVVRLRLIPGMEMLHEIALPEGEDYPQTISMKIWSLEHERWELVFARSHAYSSRQTTSAARGEVLYEFLTADLHGVEDELAAEEQREVELERGAAGRTLASSMREVYQQCTTTATATVTWRGFNEGDFQWLATDGAYLHSSATVGGITRATYPWWRARRAGGSDR